MITIEFSGIPIPDVPEVFQARDKLIKHLKHHLPPGKKCRVTVVDSTSREVGQQGNSPFLRIYLSADEQAHEIVGIIDECPHLNIAKSYDLEVIPLLMSRSRER